MILGVGMDLCEVDRMREALARRGFLERYFTEAEQAYLRGKNKAMPESMAGHFAAKEAGLKALGCGIVLPLTDIAIMHTDEGAPRYLLTGKALARMHALGGSALHLSITHTNDMAAAVAILEG